MATLSGRFKEAVWLCENGTPLGLLGKPLQFRESKALLKVVRCGKASKEAIVPVWRQDSWSMAEKPDVWFPTFCMTRNVWQLLFHVICTTLTVLKRLTEYEREWIVKPWCISSSVFWYSKFYISFDPLPDKAKIDSLLLLVKNLDWFWQVSWRSLQTFAFLVNTGFFSSSNPNGSTSNTDIVVSKFAVTMQYISFSATTTALFWWQVVLFLTSWTDGPKTTLFQCNIFNCENSFCFAHARFRMKVAI